MKKPSTRSSAAIRTSLLYTPVGFNFTNSPALGSMGMNHVEQHQDHAPTREWRSGVAEKKPIRRDGKVRHIPTGVPKTTYSVKMTTIRENNYSPSSTRTPYGQEHHSRFFSWRNTWSKPPPTHIRLNNPSGGRLCDNPHEL